MAKGSKTSERATAAIAAGNVVSVTLGGNTLSLPGGKTLKVVKKVTIPTLSQKGNDVVAFKVIGKMYIGKEIKPKDGKPQQEAATLLPVIDLNDGIEKVYVVPAIFKSELADTYKGDYIGKCFACQKMPIQEGKRHRNMNILEIEE